MEFLRGLETSCWFLFIRGGPPKISQALESRLSSRKDGKRLASRLFCFSKERHVSETVESRIREYASSRTAVKGIAPQRLHREGSCGQGDIRRSALSRRDPGALVSVLLST